MWCDILQCGGNHTIMVINPPHCHNNKSFSVVCTLNFYTVIMYDIIDTLLD